MSLGPIPLFLVLAGLMVGVALAVSFVRGRWLRLPRNTWTNLAWSLLAAIVAYFVIQGLRHP